MKHGLEVKIWGTRGSLAAPYADRMEFGGNTSCVSVRWSDQIVIFDCGTGLHGLGQELIRLRESAQNCRTGGCSGEVWHVPEEIHIFIGHVHLDHICALPFFPLLFRKGWKIHLYGQPMEGESFKDTVRRIVGPPFWPVTLDQAAAEIAWHDLVPDMVVELPDGVSVQTFEANHGPGALLFRMTRGDVSVVYGLDNEVTYETMDAYSQFVDGCDLLIFDGMYTEEEYKRCKGFGHSVWMQGVWIAGHCKVGTVCISHHEWNRTDAVLKEMEALAREENDRCVFAREGMVFFLSREL